MYLLHKEEHNMFDEYGIKADELMLYHATSPEIATVIAHKNIDWRKTKRSRYGIGAYFSTCPYYADKYSTSNGGRYLLI